MTTTPPTREDVLSIIEDIAAEGWMLRKGQEVFNAYADHLEAQLAAARKVSDACPHHHRDDDDPMGEVGPAGWNR